MNDFLKYSVLTTALFLFSCEYKEVNTDAKSYCDCKEREYAGEGKPGECAKLLQTLKNKYEYLPEQQEILALKMADCLAGE
ncbi:hypothetical protein N8328_02180 [Crocinitomicaceae bacterium]|jgi:hypothetical protein|nr:hypothetical protein [Crocinitomicaceae bacterium]